LPGPNAGGRPPHDIFHACFERTAPLAPARRLCRRGLRRGRRRVRGDRGERAYLVPAPAKADLGSAELALRTGLDDALRVHGRGGLARTDRLAAILWLPYLLWVSFAACLNAAIVHLN
jgi:hypothetical protein